jgi:hypothetical protein
VSGRSKGSLDSIQLGGLAVATEASTGASSGAAVCATATTRALGTEWLNTKDGLAAQHQTPLWPGSAATTAKPKYCWCGAAGGSIGPSHQKHGLASSAWGYQSARLATDLDAPEVANQVSTC